MIDGRMSPDGSFPDDVAVYDLKGLKCPLPVMRTAKRLTLLDVGDLLIVETSDPLAVIDIPHFCSEAGHRLEAQEATGRGHRFLIRKT